MSRSQDLSIWKDEKQRSKEESCQVYLRPQSTQDVKEHPKWTCLTKKQALANVPWLQALQDRWSIILSPASSVLKSIPPTRLWKCIKWKRWRTRKWGDCRNAETLSMKWKWNDVDSEISGYVYHAPGPEQIATDLEHGSFGIVWEMRSCFELQRHLLFLVHPVCLINPSLGNTKIPARGLFRVVQFPLVQFLLSCQPWKVTRFYMANLDIFMALTLTGWCSFLLDLWEQIWYEACECWIRIFPKIIELPLICPSNPCHQADLLKVFAKRRRWDTTSATKATTPAEIIKMMIGIGSGTEKVCLKATVLDFFGKTPKLHVLKTDFWKSDQHYLRWVEAQQIDSWHRLLVVSC